jgi:hypothetical protein
VPSGFRISMPRVMAVTFLFAVGGETTLKIGCPYR